MRDPFRDFAKTPVVGRVLLRAFALVIAVISLAYAPVFVRLSSASEIEQIRAFIVCSLICIASVFGNLDDETEQNYVGANDVQTQHRVFSATMC